MLKVPEVTELVIHLSRAFAVTNDLRSHNGLLGTRWGQIYLQVLFLVRIDVQCNDKSYRWFGYAVDSAYPINSNLTAYLESKLFGLDPKSVLHRRHSVVAR